MKKPDRRTKWEGKERQKRRLSPRTAAWIVVILALLASVLVSVGLTGQKTKIVLPNGSAAATPTASETQSFTLSDADITKDNVQQVIADLRRPDSYSLSIKNTVYWDTDWSECQVNLYVLDGVSLTEYYNTTQEVDRYELIKGKKYYSWRVGQKKFHKGKNGSVTADQNSMIPTYESIAQVDRQAVTDAGLRTVNSEPCVYCVVNDEKSGYTITYYVSTVTGLLMQADYTEKDTLVRSVIVTAVENTAPGAEKFVLPNGRNVVTGVKSDPPTTAPTTTADSTTVSTDDTQSTTVSDASNTGSASENGETATITQE